MAHRLNDVSVGMTKQEVIATMGKPDSVSATNGVEYLSYRLATSLLDTDGSDTADYFVRPVNGRVDAYGRKGDFDSTKDPTIHVKKDVTVR